MVVSVDKAKISIVRYLENEIARKATGLQKFATYYVIGSLDGKADKIISGLQENEVIKMLGVFDENGNINIDDVYTAAKQAMERSGSVSVYGVTFYPSDIDTIYQYMKS